jgi:cell division transport system ATP-binding protein
VIELQNVTIAHRGLPVVRDLTMRIDAGDVIVLSGETGSGKTSLLRALYGDMPVASGTIRIDGVDLRTIQRTALPELRRRMGLIFQDDKLLADRSVYDNLRFALSIQMDSWRAIKRRAMELLAELGLSHVRSLMPDQLSGGESQRIGVARALANAPDIILADEPTANLDAETATHIFRYIADRRTPGTIVIIATHDAERAFAVFPDARCGHLEQGRLVERRL